MRKVGRLALYTSGAREGGRRWEGGKARREATKELARHEGGKAGKRRVTEAMVDEDRLVLNRAARTVPRDDKRGRVRHRGSGGGEHIETIGGQGHTGHKATAQAQLTHHRPSGKGGGDAGSLQITDGHQVVAEIRRVVPRDATRRVGSKGEGGHVRDSGPSIGGQNLLRGGKRRESTRVAEDGDCATTVKDKVMRGRG